MDKLKELVSDAIQCCYDTNGYEVDFDNGDTENCVLLNDANYALEEAIDSYSPWISVEDELPNPEDGILMFDGKIYSGRGNVLIHNVTSPEPSMGKTTRYTHWMPLPAPPVK